MPNIVSNVELGDGSIYELNDPSAESTLLAHATRLLAAEAKLDTIEEGAEVNQNAFSIVRVGSTNISADSTNDMLKLVAGDNIILTPDAPTGCPQPIKPPLGLIGLLPVKSIVPFSIASSSSL